MSTYGAVVFLSDSCPVSRLYPKRDSGTSSSSITWELMRNADSE